MFRVTIILAAALFCVLNAPLPDPRVLSAIDAATQPSSQLPDDLAGEFFCPMDSDVRSSVPGFCPRCGMKLTRGVKDIVEYPIHLSIAPSAPVPGELTHLTFGIVDPKSALPVRNFEIVHERLYHIFVVSQDLTFFLHTHPERNGNQDFQLDVRFPKPGMYRVLSDFYPSGGTPQLITNTVLVPGHGFSLRTAHIGPDLSPRRTENSKVELEELPNGAHAGEKSTLVFRVTPDQGIEPYLGTMAHMLAASSDLIDMMHDHPFQTVDRGAHTLKELTFNLIFPREGVYRVWVQFQR